MISENSKYVLSYEQFKELFQEAKFIIYEENDETIDTLRDEEYYSWKHK